MSREKVVINDVEDNDDLDWLESPPMVPVNKTKPCENSLIKELRYNNIVRCVGFCVDNVCIFFLFVGLFFSIL